MKNNLVRALVIVVVSLLVIFGTIELFMVMGMTPPMAFIAFVAWCWLIWVVKDHLDRRDKRARDEAIRQRNTKKVIHEAIRDFRHG